MMNKLFSTGGGFLFMCPVPQVTHKTRCRILAALAFLATLTDRHTLKNKIYPSIKNSAILFAEKEKNV